MLESSHISQEMPKEKFLNDVELLPQQENKETEAAITLCNLKKNSNTRTSKKRSKAEERFAALVNEFSTFMSGDSGFIKNKEACDDFIKRIRRKDTMAANIYGRKDDLDSDPVEPGLIIDEDRDKLQSTTVSNSTGTLVTDEDMNAEVKFSTVSNNENENAELSDSMVILGSKGTKILKSHLAELLMRNTKVREDRKDVQLKKTTRLLLDYFFTKDTLATSSLSGTPSPAFPGKTPKKALDRQIVEDIVEYVAKKCNGHPQQVRATITSKCADECKLKRVRDNKSNMYKRKRDEGEIEEASVKKIMKITIG